jgi:serine/threonine-protein kinase
VKGTNQAMGILDRVKSLLGGGKLDVRQRFELLREAVHGTMSQFYLARDRQTGKTVGLKLLDRKKTEQFEKRFRGFDKPSEGEIAASIKHPFVVDTFEYGVTTKDQHYLVMEYLEGQGLNTLIAAKSNPLVEARLTLLRQAAEAVAAVHQAGFIHRDICPRNFVVASDYASLKLIDFGLTVPDSKPFRQPGNRTGTPRYMSPEVVRRRPTDHRVDIFSFGVTAYELFTFAAPWPSSDTTGKKAMEHDKPPVPIVEVHPNIDPRLAEAIHACLSPNPADRPHSMQQLLQMIERS